MIITIGLISAKLLSFEQSIGIILGQISEQPPPLEFLAYRNRSIYSAIVY